MNRIEIAALILIAAGALIPVLCIIKMLLIKRFKKNAVLTTAVITHSERRTGMKNSVYYMLAIQYKDAAGNIFTGSAVGAKKNVPGTTIPIMYASTDPANFKTDFGKYLPWLLGFSLIFLGLLIWFSYWLLHNTYMVKPQ
jgi:hypothetical protein